MKNKNAVSSRGGLIQRMLLTPYSVWALLFIVVPLFFIAFYAFTDSQMHFTLDNMRKVFTYRINEDQSMPYYVMVFGRSFKLAVISTLICLLLGYPSGAPLACLRQSRGLHRLKPDPQHHPPHPLPRRPSRMRMCARTHR